MQQADFADLDAFTAVARARGFRAAAALRGVSASSLSEAVRRLETRLGVRLLNRTTRSVTPTEAGQKLLERLSPALADVALALDEVNAFRDSPTGTLRLNVPGIVAKVILPRLLPRFLEPTAAITILVPILLPIATQLGIDPIHFGLVMVLNLMIGLLHPPMGMVLFVLARVAGLSFERTTMAILPWLVPLLLALVVITYVPSLVLWLPKMFF